jgi:transcriptional antiterminator RfaH
LVGKTAIVREEEIATIKELLSENSYKEVRLATLEPGDSLILKEGIFKGQTATFKEQKGNKTILTLNGLGTKLILKKIIKNTPIKERLWGVMLFVR